MQIIEGETSVKAPFPNIYIILSIPVFPFSIMCALISICEVAVPHL